LDLEQGELGHIEEWRATPMNPPLLSPEGDRVASLTEAPGFVRVLAENGAELDRIEAQDLLAFPGQDAVLLDRITPHLWALGLAETRARELIGSEVTPVGPDPAGVLYQTVGLEELKVAFMNALDLGVQELGGGRLGAHFGSRVLLLDSSSSGEEGLQGRILDLEDPSVDLPVSLPPQRFSDPQMLIQMLSPSQILIEFPPSASCLEKHPGSTRSIWDDLLDDEEPWEHSGDPHHLLVHSESELIIILDVSPCGAPEGGGIILDRLSGERYELEELIEAPIRGAQLSPDGRYAALALSDGVAILDLAARPPIPYRVEGLSGRADTWLRFL